MTLIETIRHIAGRLAPVYGQGEADAMARIIIETVKGYTPVDIALNADKEVSQFIASKTDAIIDRALRYEPLQYILGETRWHGMTLKVTSAVLIPRQETSELVDIIFDAEGSRSDLRVLDLCTGSGCIAIALARNLPFANVTGADVSPDALAVARENAAALHARVNFVEADVLKADFFSRSYDVIVSNPPYVLESERKEMSRNVTDYEPSIALFVPDDDPLRFYKAIERIASRSLTDGGRLYFEINPLEADNLAAYMRSKGWNDVTLVRDIHGKNRFLTATLSL